MTRAVENEKAISTRRLLFIKNNNLDNVANEALSKMAVYWQQKVEKVKIVEESDILAPKSLENFNVIVWSVTPSSVQSKILEWINSYCVQNEQYFILFSIGPRLPDLDISIFGSIVNAYSTLIERIRSNIDLLS